MSFWLREFPFLLDLNFLARKTPEATSLNSGFVEFLTKIRCDAESEVLAALTRTLLAASWPSSFDNVKKFIVKWPESEKTRGN